MVYTDGELPHRAKSVFIYLCDRADGQGKCWPGIKTIAEDLNLSRSTVKRALADLEKACYIEKAARHRDNGSNTSNLYTVLKRSRPPP